MARQAQSKEKVLGKMMRSGLTDKVEHERALDFKFPDPGKLSPPVLQCNDITFGYPGCEILYSGVDFGVDLDSRVALVGPNGAGKSTLLKIMTGELMPVTGSVRPHAHLRISKFTQHFIDVLDLAATPLEYFLTLWPDMTREDGRKFLGRFGVSGSVQTQIMGQLSDGQKSRVVLAKMAKENPHMLFLDEPTNHLDMESIDSLAKAINGFGGGLVLVSHDMRLISQVAKEIWMCDNRTVTKFVGEINDFKMHLKRQMMRDNLIDADPSKMAAPVGAIQFVPLAPLKTFAASASIPTFTVAPPLPPPAAVSAKAAPVSEEDAIRQARLELADLAIAKQRARQNAEKNGGKEEDTSGGAGGGGGGEAEDGGVEEDEESKRKQEEKLAARAKRKAEKEAIIAMEKQAEEERQRRKEEKARDLEEARKLREEEKQAHDEWLEKKAAKDAKLKAAEDAEAARIAEILAKRREEKEARRLAKQEARAKEEAARQAAAEAAVLADPWTQQQQDAFENALLTYTNALEKQERWTSIANEVEGKGRNQCMARYKFLKNFVAVSKKAAAAPL